MGTSASEVRATLRAIRLRGWDITQGQLTPGVTGIAVPILDPGGEILGSLSLTVGTPDMPESDRQRLVEQVKFCSLIIRTALGQN